MSMWIGIAMLCLSPQGGPAAKESGKIEMIFWEKQSWKTGGPSRRLTLWADGRSEVMLKRSGKPRKPRPGWSVREEGPWTVYTRVSPYPAAEARKRFREAIAAGIGELRSFRRGYVDGSGTVAGVGIDGKVTKTVIPMFLREGEKDNKGSENHERFLAVDAILGHFDSDAIAE